MWVVLTERVVKQNTNATAKFAPRTANQQMLRVSGPFLSLKAAQRAVLVALSTHTCLDAQVWSRGQVEEKLGKPHSMRMEEARAMADAKRLMEVA